MAETSHKKFTGRELHVVDAKGRTSMPSRLREIVLETSTGKDAPNLVLVPWFDECARVYPVNRWRAWVAELDSLLATADAFGFGEDESDIRRLIYGQAQDTAMDGFGRFNLPAHAREVADIGPEVVWLGLGEFMELWNPERLDARLSGENSRRLRERLRALSASARRSGGDVSSPEVAVRP